MLFDSTKTVSTLHAKIFPFRKLVFGEGFNVRYKPRNIDTLRGLNFIIDPNQNAQDELHHHARAEDDDLRDGGEPGAVAEDSAALSLHSLPRTEPRVATLW